MPSNAADARMMSPAPGIADHSRLRTWRRSAASPRAATPEQRDVQDPHGEVGQAPEHAVVAERARCGERDDEERAHRQGI